MTRVLVDDLLRTKLHDLTQPLEFCDSEGRVVGRYLPVVDASLYEGLESPLSKEGLQRRRQNKGKTFTTAEVLEHLEKL